jgi:hypothetical protein
MQAFLRAPPAAVTPCSPAIRADLRRLASHAPGVEITKRYLARHLYRDMQNATPLTT